MLENIKGHDKWLDPPSETEEICEYCLEPLVDCENGLGCIRCAHCHRREGECLDGDCPESEHLQGCEFPAEECSCRLIRKRWYEDAGDRATNAAIKERHVE
jgi:hypothetical protein